jgi:hypothetical protein
MQTTPGSMFEPNGNRDDVCERMNPLLKARIEREGIDV